METTKIIEQIETLGFHESYQNSWKKTDDEKEIEIKLWTNLRSEDYDTFEISVRCRKGELVDIIKNLTK